MPPQLKLTEERVTAILDALRLGVTQENAARYAGIHPSTYYRWLEEGGSDNAAPEFREFKVSVEKARAEAEVRNVAIIADAAKRGTWQAAAWFLERSMPKDWSATRKTELTGADGGPVSVSVDTETLESRLSALVAKRRATPSEEATDATGPVVE